MDAETAAEKLFSSFKQKIGQMGRIKNWGLISKVQILTFCVEKWRRRKKRQMFSFKFDTDISKQIVGMNFHRTMKKNTGMESHRPHLVR